MRQHLNKYQRFEHIGCCPIKGDIFSCFRRDGKYDIIAKKDGVYTVLITYSIIK